MKPYLRLFVEPLPPGAMARDVSRAVLRRELSRIYGGDPAAWEFARDARGKPGVANACAPGLDFSVSYSDGLLAVAIAGGIRVGLDLERIIPSTIPEGEGNPIAGALTANELRHLEALSRESRWTETLDVWTRKEALVKLVGVGTDLDAETVEVIPAPRFYGSAIDARGIRIRSRLIFRGPDRYRLALATDRRR